MRVQFYRCSSQDLSVKFGGWCSLSVLGSNLQRGTAGADSVTFDNDSEKVTITEKVNPMETLEEAEDDICGLEVLTAAKDDFWPTKNDLGKKNFRDKRKAELLANNVQGQVGAPEQNSEIKQTKKFKRESRDPLAQVLRDNAVRSTNIRHELKESASSLKLKALLNEINRMSDKILRESSDKSQAAKGAKCESGTYSAEDLILEVEDRREDGYFLSSEWLLSLEENQKYSLMSILSRAGYSETYRTGATTLFERIENDVQNRIDANIPSSMGTTSDICTKDLQQVEVRRGGDAVEGLNIYNRPGIATTHDLQYLRETSGDLRIAGTTMKVEDSHNTTNSLAASAPGKDELTNMPPEGKGKERLPPEITAEALFKYVQLPGFEDGENDSAYQATIKIGGSVFKGVLCDQGVDNRGSGDQQRNVAHPFFRGGTPSSSSLVDPSNLYGNPLGSALLGGKGRLPPEITAEALFKYVQLPGFEDGANDFAYQATIKIGGSVFKGVLCDQGMDNGGSCVQQRNVAYPFFRGGGTPSSSSLSDPSNLPGNPPGSALLGVKGRLPPEIRARALFKCVQLPGVENGGNEFAYQASVNIRGHVFKGVLYDQGVDNEGPSDNEGSSVQSRNVANLQLAGRSRPSSWALSDPSNLCVNKVPRCQVEDCEQDLCDFEQYRRRYNVCVLHSKASKAMVAGLDQRFCEQCSRFHPLLEFDEDKRSCRRRLEGRRNRRQRPESAAGLSSRTFRDRRQRPESAAGLSSRTFVFPSGGSHASNANVHEKFTTSNSDHSLEEELTTLKTFLSTLKSSHQHSYAVSTGWLSCLEEHEKKELETIVSEAGYTKIHQESNMTTFEKIRDDVGLPPGILCNNPTSTSDKTEVGASGPGKQELSRSCGLLRNDKLKGKLDEDTTTDPFSVASAVEKGQTQGEDSRCQPQTLKVACTSLSETSTIPSTISSRGPNLRHFRRQQVGDCSVTMPRKGESHTISTAMERPFYMKTVEVPKDESTCREVCATLKATATTTTSCCLKINHTSKKIRVKFSKISGEVRNENATGQRCNALALSSVRTNVYACLNKVETEDESEEVILNLEDGRRALDDDLSWLEVSGRNPINCEPGSITLELQGNVRRRCKADLAAEVQRAHILHFQDAHAVVLEGELPVALNSRQFLELNVRYQLEVSYIKPCTPIPKGAKFVPGRRTSEVIDFDCCLDFVTKEFSFD